MLCIEALLNIPRDNLDHSQLIPGIASTDELKETTVGRKFERMYGNPKLAGFLNPKPINVTVY